MIKVQKVIKKYSRNEKASNKSKLFNTSLVEKTTDEEENLDDVIISA